MLVRRDSNPDKENQNLLCYHYTTDQSTLGGTRTRMTAMKTRDASQLHHEGKSTHARLSVCLKRRLRCVAYGVFAL